MQFDGTSSTADLPGISIETELLVIFLKMQIIFTDYPNLTEKSIEWQMYQNQNNTHMKMHMQKYTQNNVGSSYK